MGEVVVVVGGQYGSEGKGAVAGFLAEEMAMESETPSFVRVSGPNAGHTVFDSEGVEWKLRQIPVGAVVCRNAPLYIGQQSEIDPPVLRDEMAALDKAGYGVSDRLMVDSQATVIEDSHKEREADLIKAIGSTGKGIGAARSDRIMRTAKLARDVLPPGMVDDTQSLMRHGLSNGGDLMIEAAQGYALGLHAGRYPTCTSNNSRAIDALAYAGISPWDPAVSSLRAVVCLRTYPIRVAGDSGPMYKETSWEELATRTGGHISPERTTVTQKIRRVGEWDSNLARESVQANGGWSCEVALGFLDYVFPEVAGAASWEEILDKELEAADYVKGIEDQIGAPIFCVGTGPSTYVHVGAKHA